MNAIEKRSMRVINIQAGVRVLKCAFISLMAGLHWLYIDVPLTPLVEELLKFIFPVAQVKEQIHSIRMHRFIKFFCACVCDSQCEYRNHGLFLLLKPLCSLLNDPALALNKT